MNVVNVLAAHTQPNPIITTLAQNKQEIIYSHTHTAPQKRTDLENIADGCNKML